MLNNMTRKPTSAVSGWAVEPYTGLGANQHMSAPTVATQGTALSAAGSFAGRSYMDTAVAVIDLPGSHPPREAPV